MKRASIGIGLALPFALLGACGGGHSDQPTVLAATNDKQTQTDGGTETPPADDLTARVLADETKAADILRQAIRGSARDIAAWAAVYARMLGIQHREQASIAALKKGVGTSDPLLQALCWRWLGALGNVSLPRWSANTSSDPVVRAFAALSMARRGKVPKKLKSALGLPRGKPRGADSSAEFKARTETLLAFSAPFDRGPLALAVTFVEARRAEAAERTADGGLNWVARRLRRELLEITIGENPAAMERIKTSKNVVEAAFCDFGQLLENPLVKQPLNTLHAAALTGTPALRVSALRALATPAFQPVSGSFGAAAAAFSADDPRVRIESARTFLLLAKRAHQAPHPVEMHSVITKL